MTWRDVKVKSQPGSLLFVVARGRMLRELRQKGTPSTFLWALAESHFTRLRPRVGLVTSRARRVQTCAEVVY